MKITTLLNAKKVPFDLDGKIMFSDKKNEIISLMLKPNEVLELHTNPFDAIFYVLKGTAEFFTTQLSLKIEENSCFELKKEVERGWRNNSDDVLQILVFKRLA